jgi:hypothetical protein
MTETITSTLDSAAVFGQSYTITAGQHVIILLLLTLLCIQVTSIAINMVYDQ